MAIESKDNDLVQRIVDTGISVNDKVSNSVTGVMHVYLLFLMRVYYRELWY